MESRPELNLDLGPGKGAAPADQSVRAYLRVLKKRKWVMLATLVLVTGLFVAWNMHAPRIYVAEASVIIDPVAPKGLPDGQEVVELGAGHGWDNHEYYNTQIRVLKSHSLAREVVRKHLELIHDKRVIPEPKPTDTDDDLIEQAADYLQDGVRVLPVRDSRVFGIGFADRDAQLAADIANGFSAVFIEQNRTVKVDATQKATRDVAKSLDAARKDLDNSENALYLYKKDNNILSVNLEERQNLIARDLDDFSHASTTTKEARIDLQARRRAIAGVMAGDAADAPSSYVAQSPGIATLRVAYLEERRKLNALIDRYGEKWPEVIAQKQRTDSALDDLRNEGKLMLRSIDAEIVALTEAEAKYGDELKRLKTEALELNEREVDYKKLIRAEKDATDEYARYQKRSEEITPQQHDLSNNIRTLDDATKPLTPSEPRIKQAIVLGLALGIVLALALAFFVEMLDRTVKSQEDVEAVLGLPFLGLVPAVVEPSAAGKGARDLHVVHHPSSAAAECCRVVRTNIMFCSPDKPLRSLLVTSSNPLEGKTITTVNLGAVMAHGGSRTLLVDTDMRRPRLHKILGASNEHGVSRLIVGDGDIDAAIKTTEVPNLFLLPCGPVPPNPAELLQTERFAQLVRELGKRFDRILFDSPPVLAVTDAVVLSRVVDGTVVVARAGRTTYDAALNARRHLGAVNANIIGVVLNDVDLKNPHYAGYYGYTSKYYGLAEGERDGAGRS